MKNLPYRPTNDPFATLVTLFSGALLPPPAEPRRNGGLRPAGILRAKLIDRVERWAWKARQRDVERALASATDLADVEARLRALERGVLHRYY